MTTQKKVSIKDLEEAVKELNLKISKNKYGLKRAQDGDFTIAQYRPTKYGFRFYLGGTDHIKSCYRVTEKTQISKLVDTMKKLQKSRKVFADKPTIYKVNTIETQKKGDIIKHLVGSL